MKQPAASPAVNLRQQMLPAARPLISPPPTDPPPPPPPMPRAPPSLRCNRMVADQGDRDQEHVYYDEQYADHHGSTAGTKEVPYSGRLLPGLRAWSYSLGTRFGK